MNTQNFRNQETPNKINKIFRSLFNTMFDATIQHGGLLKKVGCSYIQMFQRSSRVLAYSCMDRCIYLVFEPIIKISFHLRNTKVKYFQP